MIAEQMRIPDLWLKRALALALIPEGSHIDWITNLALAQCVSGESATASQLNHMISADNHVRVKDELFYLAATLEYLVLFGPSKDFRQFARAEVAKFIEGRGKKLALWEDPILGTFSTFADALIKLVEQRPDFADKGEAHFRKRIAQQLHQELMDAVPEGDAIRIKILSGPTPDAALASGLDKRIIRQSLLERPRVFAGDSIQLVVPPHGAAQKLLGFELRTDAQVASKPWEKAGGWLGVHPQEARKAGHLLSDGALVSAEPGEFWVQAIGVNAVKPNDDALPVAVRKLITGRPAHWPDGYAESMALVTFVRRTIENARKAKSKRKRLGEPEDGEALPPVRLYCGSYTVVERS